MDHCFYKTDIQKFLGYCTSPFSVEHKIFIVHGNTNVIDRLIAMMGDKAMQLEEWFFKKNHKKILPVTCNILLNKHLIYSRGIYELPTHIVDLLSSEDVKVQRGLLRKMEKMKFKFVLLCDYPPIFSNFSEIKDKIIYYNITEDYSNLSDKEFKRYIYDGDWRWFYEGL